MKYDIIEACSTGELESKLEAMASEYGSITVLSIFIWHDKLHAVFQRPVEEGSKAPYPCHLCGLIDPTKAITHMHLECLDKHVQDFLITPEEEEKDEPAIKCPRCFNLYLPSRYDSCPGCGKTGVDATKVKEALRIAINLKDALRVVSHERIEDELGDLVDLLTEALWEEK